MATLILRLRDRELHSLAITKSPVVIGRDPSCDLVIDNPGISRRHATVELKAGSFFIYDVDSANGLFQDGRKLTSKQLVEGDEIQIGKFTVAFTAKGGAAPAHIRHVTPAGMSLDDVGAETVNLPAEYMVRMRDTMLERDEARSRRAEVEAQLEKTARAFRILLVLLGAVGAALVAAIVVLVAV